MWVYVYLDHRPVNDTTLAHVGQLTYIKGLELGHTRVTDAGLEYLKGLTRLEWIDLRETKVTEEGAKRLQKALPSCTIMR